VTRSTALQYDGKLIQMAPQIHVVRSFDRLRPRPQGQDTGIGPGAKTGAAKCRDQQKK
jgi:hypothetical protein